MQHVHFFQYNIPAENQFYRYPDRYINVIAEWNGNYHSDSITPYVLISPVNMTFSDALEVEDWHKAIDEIESIAEKHFTEIAKQDLINQAKTTLIAEEQNNLHPIFQSVLDAHRIK